MHFAQKINSIALIILIVVTFGVHSEIEQFIETEHEIVLSGFPRYDAEVRLKRLLLKDFVTDSLPPRNASDPVLIKLNLEVIVIQELDAKMQLLTIEGRLKMEWYDARLEWNSDRFDGIRDIRVQDKLIWKPDIRLYNGNQGFKGHSENDVLASVQASGRIGWNPSVTLKSSCSFDLQYYPYDEHTCSLKFGSWSHDGYHIDLAFFYESNNPDFSDSFNNAGEWDIIGGKGEKTVIYYACCPEPYVDLTFSLFLGRRSPFYKVAILCPVVAAVFLMMTSLWISPSYDQRVTVNFVSLILFVTTLLFLFLQLPAVSDKVPLIVSFCGRLVIVNIIIIIIAILFSSIARKLRHFPLHNRIRSITGSRLAVNLLVPPPKSFDACTSPFDDENGSADDIKSLQTDYFYHWISFFQFIDRILFVVFTVVIIILLITASN